jgi:hypothetical protein
LFKRIEHFKRVLVWWCFQRESLRFLYYTALHLHINGSTPKVIVLDIFGQRNDAFFFLCVSWWPFVVESIRSVILLHLCKRFFLWIKHKIIIHFTGWISHTIRESALQAALLSVV